jgi:hypothetical protein
MSPFQHIQNYTRLKDRKTVSQAVKYAVKSNFIERGEQGYFDPDAGKLSKAAVYAVKWLNRKAESLDGQKTPPADIPLFRRSEIPTGNGLISRVRRTTFFRSLSRLSHRPRVCLRRNF